jgi:hypothetical protein
MGCADRSQRVSIWLSLSFSSVRTSSRVHISFLHTGHPHENDRPTDCCTREITLAVAEVEELGRHEHDWEYGRRMVGLYAGLSLPKKPIVAERSGHQQAAGGDRFEEGDAPNEPCLLPSNTSVHNTTYQEPLSPLLHNHSTTYGTYPALDKVYVIAIAYHVRLLAGPSQTACWS